MRLDRQTGRLAGEGSVMGAGEGLVMGAGLPGVGEEG